jgi:hypothetical protein
MLIAANEPTKNVYKKAKEERLRQEKPMVHRGLHPLFHKTREELREYDENIYKKRRRKKNKIKGVGRLVYTYGVRRR